LSILAEKTRKLDSTARRRVRDCFVQQRPGHLDVIPHVGQHERQQLNDPARAQEDAHVANEHSRETVERLALGTLELGPRTLLHFVSSEEPL
jgi:hypothetical protein